MVWNILLCSLISLTAEGRAGGGGSSSGGSSSGGRSSGGSKISIFTSNKKSKTSDEDCDTDCQIIVACVFGTLLFLIAVLSLIMYF